MSGQGPQWWGMGRDLSRQEPVFRRTLEACASAMAPWKYRLLEELGRPETASRLDQTEIAQPAIFAMQMALAELWKSWGVEPAAVVGHSVGEVASACLAGVLTLEQAARVIVLRARFMSSCARGGGTMLAVGLGEDEARALISGPERGLTVAAYNSPRSHTLSGPRAPLEALAAELGRQEIFARLVRVDHPFHSSQMQPAAEALEQALADLAPREETLPFFSTVTGKKHFGRECDSSYWGRGIVQPVRFAAAVDALIDFGVDVWLEIGAHPALSVSVQECLSARGEKRSVLASARRERECESMLESAMDLHCLRVPIDFAAMTPSRRLLSVPSYAWDKSRWWSESSDWREGRIGDGGRGFLDSRLPRAVPTWLARLDGRHMAFLQDHRVEDVTIFPASAFVEMALEAGLQLFEGRSFILEDFEIRKPLLLSGLPSGLQLELAYDQAARTFTIHSRQDQGMAWAVHALGSMRGERVDSAFAASTWSGTRPGDLEPVDLEGFYRHMGELGLRYGPEFRPIRELAAGEGRSTGRVALSEKAAQRAGEYPLHPVLFDGALQVFSAGAATVEGRRTRLKLPVRFDRILFLRSPGARTLVRSRLRQFSDEFVEGELCLYDEKERPCVLVDGFRAISVAGFRQSASSRGRDILYHVGWQRTPEPSWMTAGEPVPLGVLQRAASDTLEEVVAARGRAKLEADLAACDDLAAGQLARGLREAGLATPDGVIAPDCIGVADSMRPAFERLLNGLARHGLLEAVGSGYRPAQAFEIAAESAEGSLRRFLSKHPGLLCEGLLCAANCAELGPILRGEKDAVQILFSAAKADLLDQFYADGLFTSHWLAAIAGAVREAARHLPEGRGLRILEVGAGTGGLTSHILPLLEPSLHAYTFSDVSAAFFAGATQKFAEFPEVKFEVLDLEKPATEQGFEAGGFDLVLGANVFHAVSEVRVALRNVCELLAPGGSLVFIDIATPQLWTDAIFGLTSGWWRFKDRDLRPEHPLLQRSQWERLLLDSGFSEAASLPGLIGPTGGEGQIGLFARKAWRQPDRPGTFAAPASLEAAEGTSWLVFADDSGLGDRLVSQLRASGTRCRVARRGFRFEQEGDDAFTLRQDSPEDWKRLCEACAANDAPRHFVYMWVLDPPAETDRVLMGADALLHLAQAIESTWPATKLRIDLVTRGAQLAGRTAHPVLVSQAPVIGFLRVILSEHPHFSCKGIDLPPTVSELDDAFLCSELLRNDSEREIAFRGEARYVQRLGRGRPRCEQWLDSSVPLRLGSHDRGHVDSLRFSPFELPVCGSREVLIEVKAAGVNFRDVLKALALYPGEAPDARVFGDEVAGIVRAAGAEVSHVAPGSRVFGIATSGLATHAVARAGDVRAIPPGLSFEEAATLPVVFMTAWHALKNIARLRAGERILVHSGAGGIGMAAIQIAHHLGAEIIATAGNPTKRALLETLGVSHVVDSRRADFSAAIMELTGRRGVDVVLNSLAAEAIPMGLSCLAEFGRFVEIGKRDLYQNSRIPLWPLRRNASFHVVAMDAVFHGDEELTGQLLAEVSELIEQSALSPLPYRSFPACRLNAAFRLMSQGRHIGKIVAAFPKPFVPRWGEPPVPGFTVKPDGCYLITGAFGGFGKVLALWLVESGARHLLLASRAGAARPDAEAFVEDLRRRGVEVRVVLADVGSERDVARLAAEVRGVSQPLRGVFHLAMVIDDAPLASLTADRVRSVMAPKAYGAWLLHNATREDPLDCFVMFSSVASIFGNPAQANYAAANAFLDALAHHRRALGMPALTVNWGVLGGQGYVARNERVAEFLARQGTAPIAPEEVVSLLETFLASGVGQILAIRVDWSKWRQFFRRLQENPLLEDVFASSVDDQEAGGANKDWRLKIESARPEDRGEIIAQAIREIVASVLRVKPESLRDNQPLTDLGLDSLMGAEIENSIEAAIGVGLPPTSLLRARTLGQIAALISTHMTAAPAVLPEGAASASVEASPAAESVDLEALSNEDIDRLLSGPSDASRAEVLGRSLNSRTQP